MMSTTITMSSITMPPIVPPTIAPLSSLDCCARAASITTFESVGDTGTVPVLFGTSVEDCEL
jgi:hypothetical protein